MDFQPRKKKQLCFSNTQVIFELGTFTDCLLGMDHCRDLFFSPTLIFPRRSCLLWSGMGFHDLFHFIFRNCKLSFQFFRLQCSLDIATDLRHQGWGRYRQRGRYFQSIFWLNNLEYITSKHKPLDIATSKQLTVTILLHKSWNLKSL